MIANPPKRLAGRKRHIRRSEMAKMQGTGGLEMITPCDSSE